MKIEINTGTKKFTTTSTLSPEERLEKIKKKGMEEIQLINSKIQELQLVLDSTALFKDSRVPEAMHHEINNIVMPILMGKQVEGITDQAYKKIRTLYVEQIVQKYKI